eukprot:COSAG01_NODE_1208_length_11239_cov_36.000987_15_plen_106_part_00
MTCQSDKSARHQTQPRPRRCHAIVGKAQKRLVIESRWVSKNRWYVLLNCDHGDSMTSRFEASAPCEAHRGVPTAPSQPRPRQLVAWPRHVGQRRASAPPRAVHAA